MLSIDLASGVPAFTFILDVCAILICPRKFGKRARSISFVLY